MAYFVDIVVLDVFMRFLFYQSKQSFLWKNERSFQITEAVSDFTVEKVL